MANRNKKQQATTSKRQMNPTDREVKRVPRPRVNFDGTVLEGTNFFTRELSAVNVSSHCFVIDCGNTNSVTVPLQTDSISYSLTGITKFYQDYRYRNVHLRWVPHVAPGVADAGSIIYVAYIDNPEMIANIIISNAAQNLSLIKGVKNLRTYNAWQAFDYTAPLTRRLPWFNVNPNDTYGTVDLTERSVQGLVLLCTETIGAAVDTGAVHATFSVELRNLTLSNTSM